MKGRSSPACKHCRASHRKCDKQEPSCSQCIKRNLHCEYEPSKKRKGNKRIAETSSYEPPQKQIKHDIPSTSEKPLQEQQLIQKLNNETLTGSNLERIMSILNNMNNNDNTVDGVSQILNACFKTFTPTKALGDQLQETIMSQVLWSKCNPMDQISNELLEEKASQALWFIFQANALLQMPSSEKSPYVDSRQEKHIFEGLASLMLQPLEEQFKFKGTIDIKHMIGKFTRSQLFESAKLMFSVAKSILLDPQIFPYMSINMKLAQTAVGLVYFMMIRGDGLDEAEVFLRSVKVFTERSKSIFDINVATVDESLRAQILSQQAIIRRMLQAYSSLKSIIWYTSSRKTRDKKSLRKFIKLSIRAVSLGSRNDVWNQCLIKHGENLRILKKVIEEPQDDEAVLFEKFLMTCRELRNDVAKNTQNYSHLIVACKLFIYTIEVFAMEIVTSKASSNLSFKRLAEIWELNLANEISRDCFANLPFVVVSGARLLSLFRFVCRIHTAHSIQLCSRLATEKELLDSLTFLHTDSIILDIADNKYNIGQFKQLSAELKLRQEIHKKHLLAVIEASQLATTAVNVNGGNSSAIVSTSSSSSADSGIIPRDLDTYFASMHETSNREQNSLSFDLDLDSDSVYFLDLFDWQ